MSKLDTFEINIEHKTHNDYECSYSYIDTIVLINGEVVKEYTDISAFITHFGKTQSLEKEVLTLHVWDKKIKDHVLRKDAYLPDSDFYPFTCSCGVSGCASIWQGVFQKVRKHTVEWRIFDKDKNGYHFLDKSFYRFERENYENEIRKAWKYLLDNKYLTVDNHGEESSVWEEECSWVYERFPEIIKRLEKQHVQNNSKHIQITLLLLDSK